MSSNKNNKINWINVVWAGTTEGSGVATMFLSQEAAECCLTMLTLWWSSVQTILCCFLSASVSPLFPLVGPSGVFVCVHVRAWRQDMLEEAELEDTQLCFLCSSAELSSTRSSHFIMPDYFCC